MIQPLLFLRRLFWPCDTKAAPVAAVKQDSGPGQQNVLDRLKIIGKFGALAGKAEEIEKEWQRIQQDENDAYFAFQTTGRGNEELKLAYKKGIAQGIRWCLERFAK